MAQITNFLDPLSFTASWRVNPFKFLVESNLAKTRVGQ